MRNLAIDESDVRITKDINIVINIFITLDMKLNIIVTVIETTWV